VGTVDASLPGATAKSLHSVLHLLPAPDIWQLHLHLAWRNMTHVETAHEAGIGQTRACGGCDDSWEHRHRCIDARGAGRR
jgi:hypothetical protein